jgi:hypothetical protein
MNKFIILVPVSLILTCCATPYKRYSDGFFSSKIGFSDYQIAQNVFSVSFRAGWFSDQSQVSTFVLKRAAEITRQHNFQYFTVNHTSDQTQLIKHVSLDSDGRLSTEIYKYPAITLHIKCYNDSPPKDAYDATTFFIPGS